MSNPRRLSQYGGSVRLEHASHNNASHINTLTAPPGITSNSGAFHGSQDYNQMHQLLGISTINPFEFNQEHSTERRVSHLHSPGEEIDLPAAGHNTLSHYQGGLPQEPFDKNVDAYLQGPTAPAWNPAIAAQQSPNTLGNTSQRRQLSQPFSTPQRLQVPLASDEGYYTHVRSQQDTRSERSDQSNSVTYVMRRLQATPRTIPDQQRARGISQEQASDYSMESLQSPSREGTKSDAGSAVGTIQCPFEDCTVKSKTQSDHKKHLARHKLEHICKEEDCARNNKGFATINDLNRHKSTVHKQRVEGARIYRCFAPGCNKPEKDWPRKDNFRSHLKKAHPNEDVEELTRTSEEWWAHQQSGLTNPERQQVFGSTAPPVRQHRQQVARPVTPFYQLATSDTDQAQTPSLPEAPFSQFPYVPQGAYSPFSGPTRNHQLSNRQLMTLQGYRDVSSENVNTSSGGQSSFFNSSSVTFPEQQQHSNQHRLGGAGSKRTYAQTEHHGEHLQQRNFSTNVTPRPISSHMSRTASFQEPAGHIRTANQRPRTVAHFPSLQEERQDSMEGFSAFQQLEDLHQTEYHGDLGLSGVGYGVVGGMFSGFTDNAVPDDVVPDDGVPGISVTQYEHPQTDLLSEDNTGIVDVDGLNKFLEPYRSRTEDDPEKRHVKRVLENALLSLGTATSDAKPSTDDYITELRNAAGKPVFKCTWPSCNNSKKPEGWKLKSEINKHMKRHSKPYGCTFDKCYRQFGSKSDWIRHERKRHSLQDSWRCVLHPSQTALGDQPCCKVFPSRQQFVDHLRGDHNLTKENNPDEFNSQVTKQHLNTDFQPQYWCGFCEAILRLVKKGKEGIHERYDHIAQHITGEGWHMDKWMPAYGQLTRGELRKQYPLRLTQSPIDEEEEGVSPSNATSEKSNSPIEEQSPPQEPTLPRSQHATPQHQQRVQQPPPPRASHALGSAPRTHAGQKRTASTAGLNPPTQHIQRRANYWRCHACQHYNLIAISPACNSGNCSHEPCRMCTYTYRRSMDEM